MIFTEKDKLTISSNDYTGEAKTVFDLINKYGTYEVQPTCDMENEFPKIAQEAVIRPPEKD